MKKSNLLLISLIVVILASCTKQLPSITFNDELALTINLKDDSITFFNIETQKLVNKWQLQEQYDGALLFDDNDTLLLYGKQLNKVDLYSLKKGIKITSWQTGKGFANGIVLTDDRIAFADQKTNKIRFFNYKGDEIGNVNTGKSPLTIIQGQENEQFLYTVNFSDKTLMIIDLLNYEVVKTINIHSNATGALLREHEGEIWIGGHGDRDNIEENVYIYDLQTSKLLNKIQAPLMPINLVEHDGYVYILSHGTSTVYKFTCSGDFIDSLKVAANPYDMEFRNGYLIIAGFDSNNIDFINIANFTITKTIESGKGPYQIIVGESRK